MASSSAQLHESQQSLRTETISRHRGIASLMEEMEAVDWYDQRVDAEPDGELRAVLVQNRDEEKEHASMTLEWLRRHDPVLDRSLRTYLFTTAPVIEAEQQAGGPPPSTPSSLRIGSLRGTGSTV